MCTFIVFDLFNKLLYMVCLKTPASFMNSTLMNVVWEGASFLQHVQRLSYMCVFNTFY